ncbi:MAG: class I SAM-dependent methyltransferase [Saprospiraceae bacterium]|nr:class I SAM-dependent methyltransferase [Saprospiraceae bacterium]
MTKGSTKHWQNIYQNKSDSEVSWTENYPDIAIDYIKKIQLPKESSIIDIGGGTSRFVDALLEMGYTNITVLDISKAALDRSKERLRETSTEVNWIVSNVVEFKPEMTYDFWYDRAVFHFLTNPSDISSYVDIVGKALNPKGNLLVGTFSENGPLKCSGLEVTRYSKAELEHVFSDTMKVNTSFKHIHTTPFGTTQEFQFCGFNK